MDLEWDQVDQVILVLKNGGETIYRGNGLEKFRKQMQTIKPPRSKVTIITEDDVPVVGTRAHRKGVVYHPEQIPQAEPVEILEYEDSFSSPVDCDNGVCPMPKKSQTQNLQQGKYHSTGITYNRPSGNSTKSAAEQLRLEAEKSGLKFS